MDQSIEVCAEHGLRHFSAHFHYCNLHLEMALLEGRALFAAVTCLTCLGFLLIGYDNGLMGG